MIKFQRITTTDAALYKYMEQLMTASFPSEEYRPLEELRNYTDSKPHFYCNIILHQNTPVGFITYWDFGHFLLCRALPLTRLNAMEAMAKTF